MKNHFRNLSHHLKRYRSDNGTEFCSKFAQKRTCRNSSLSFKLHLKLFEKLCHEPTKFS